MATMAYTRSRSGSSESQSLASRSSPSTPELSPCLDSIRVKDDSEYELGPVLPQIDNPDISSKSPINPATLCRSSSHTQSISRICIVGAGYVGGPTAAVVALHNPQVRVDVVDKDQSRIEQWKSRHLPIHEPKLDEIIQIVRDGAHITNHRSKNTRQVESAPTFRQPNLYFSTDVEATISKADIIFMALGTPTKTFGIGAGRATNMGAFDGSVAEVVRLAKAGAIIVDKSTVPCGTAQGISSKLRSYRSGVSIEVLSNPEFLSEGTAIDDLMRPDRVIIGSSPTSSGQMAVKALSQIYSWVPTEKIVTSNVWSSELSKLVANAMLAQRVSSINSISAICEETGADVNEIAKSIGCDSRIGPKFLKAGLGFGGSCFRKDIASLTYLAESLGLDEVADYWSQVNSMNKHQVQRFTRKVIRQLDNNLGHKKIAVLGFAFKKDTGDVRESLAVNVFAMLLEERPAEIAVFDPFCKATDITNELKRHFEAEMVDRCVRFYSDPYMACADAHATLVLNDCDQFRHNSSGVSKDSISRDGEATSNHQDKGITREGESLRITHPESITTYQLTDLPVCLQGKDCEQCEPQHHNSEDATKQRRNQRSWKSPSTRLDWFSIIQKSQQPAQIFDSRHVLDRAEIQHIAAKLGLVVQLEQIGVRSEIHNTNKWH